MYYLLGSSLLFNIAIIYNSIVQLKEMTTIGVSGEEKAIATAVDHLGTAMIGFTAILFAVDRIMALSKVAEVRKEIDIENVLL